MGCCVFILFYFGDVFLVYYFGRNFYINKLLVLLVFFVNVFLVFFKIYIYSKLGVV